MKTVNYILILLCAISIVSCKEAAQKGIGKGTKEIMEKASKKVIAQSAQEISEKTIKEATGEIAEHTAKRSLKEAMKSNNELKILYNAAYKRIGKDFTDGLATKTTKNGIIIYSEQYPTSKIIMRNNVIVARAGSLVDAGPINEFLVDILPNKIYVVDDVFRYKTDDLGRVVFCECDRTKAYKLYGNKRNPQRNRDVQKRIVEALDGKFDHNGKSLDDGGHLFSRNSGGPNELINQIPLDREVNQHGLWKQCESIEEQAIKDGKNVISSRKLLYQGTCKRPYAIEFTYIIDELKTTIVIPNE